MRENKQTESILNIIPNKFNFPLNLKSSGKSPQQRKQALFLVSFILFFLKSTMFNIFNWANSSNNTSNGNTTNNISNGAPEEVGLIW